MAFMFRPKTIRQIFKCNTRIHQTSLTFLPQNVALSQVRRQSTDLEEKVALITGGAKGIGYSIAKEFLRNGIYAVTIVDSDGHKAQESVKELTTEYGEDKVLFIEADIADSKQLDKAFKNTILHYESVNIVVNNAGIMNDMKWERQIKTNLTGTVISTLLGMQYMSKSSSGEGGAIFNIASIMSIIPSSGYPLHTMTQFGIVGFTKALGSSNHYQRTGVKIVALCPGLTSTQLFTDATHNAINENFLNEFMEEIDGCEPQKPESVANGLVAILEEAKPGTVWIVENNAKPYEVNFPEIIGLKQKKINV